MKQIQELLKITFLSMLTGLVVLMLSSSNHYSCSALDAFSGQSTLFLGIDFLKRLLIAFGIWAIGFIFYYAVKKMIRINLYLYFLALTLLSLHSFILVAATRAVGLQQSYR